MTGRSLCGGGGGAWIMATMMLATLVSAPEASAFNCSREGGSIGPSHYWATRTIEMRIVDAPGDEVSAAEIEAAVQAGVAEWNAPACSDFLITIGPSATDARARYDWAPGATNENVIVFRRRTENSAVDDWLHQPTALAITTATFVRSTGEVVDADIEFNDAAFTFSACDPEAPECEVRHDLLNSMTHELGHVVGLDHNSPAEPGATQATMFASSEEGDLEKRDLAADDEAGVCFLYPAGGETGACYPDSPREAPPDIVVSEVGGCTQTGAACPAFLLFLAVSWRKRRGSDTNL